MKASIAAILFLLAIVSSCGSRTQVKYFEDPKKQAEYDKLRDDMDYLTNLVNTQGASITSLETLMSDTQAKLTELELEDRVIGNVNPCGDMPNQFDEVLQVTSKGHYVAYFEQNGKRFLTVLPEDTLFITTDQQACRFKIVDGELVDNL